MRMAARVLAGLIAIAFIIFGVRYMFAPAGLLESAGLEVVNSLGFATMRALIGASFLTFGILLVMHTVVSQETGALRFTILFLLLSIIGRVISLVVDGAAEGATRNLIPVILLFLGSVGSLVMFLKSGKEAG